MSDSRLQGKRVLVVGASSGIGRACALRAVRWGASVVMSARRADLLAELIREAGGGVAVTGDVRDGDSCRRIAEEAAATLGSIDLLLYTVGASPLRYFADTSVDDWRQVLETNVIGPHQLIRFVLPALAPSAVVALLSSESVGRPYHGLGAYAASKAALEESVRAWKVEQPQIRWCCVTQGATMPTDFGNAFDMELLTELMQQWAKAGHVTAGVMETDDVADVLLTTLAAAVANPGVGIEHLSIRPPFPAVESADSFTEIAQSAR